LLSVWYARTIRSVHSSTTTAVETAAHIPGVAS
jgi:hypothetical protein